MNTLLAGKNAVIYGAGGAVGGAVARAFAREGAKVFLAGRTLASLDAVAKDITGAGGAVEIAQVDALDGQSVESHLDGVVRTAGRIDISFNAVGLEDIQGASLVELTCAQFVTPVTRAMTTQFVTATAAARHMARNRSGVILGITATAVHGYPNVGGFGAACAAIEAFCRQLATEMGPQGIRVICLRSAGSPDSPGLREVMSLHAEKAGVSTEAVEAGIAEHTLLKRLPKLTEVANMAVLMASDYASAVTGAIANVTCGESPA